MIFSLPIIKTYLTYLREIKRVWNVTEDTKRPACKRGSQTNCHGEQCVTTKCLVLLSSFFIYLFLRSLVQSETEVWSHFTGYWSKCIIIAFDLIAYWKHAGHSYKLKFYTESWKCTLFKDIFLNFRQRCVLTYCALVMILCAIYIMVKQLVWLMVWCL